MASLFIHFHTITENVVNLGIKNPREDQYRALKPYLKGEKNGIAILGDLAFSISKVQEKRLFIVVHHVMDSGLSSKTITLLGCYITTVLQGVFLSNQIKIYFENLEEEDKKVIHEHWTAESFKDEVSSQIASTVNNLLTQCTEFDFYLKDELNSIANYVHEKGVEYHEC